jgi:hypothetical protein
VRILTDTTPWAEGFFNRNDNAPLPLQLFDDGRVTKLTLHISDQPTTAMANFTLRCILFHADESDTFDLRLNGMALPVTTRDPQWKDPQIFSPKPQPASGGDGDYQIDPQQRLLRLDCAVPRKAWRQGPNQIEIRISARDPSTPKPIVQLEKLEAHLTGSFNR